MTSVRASHYLPPFLRSKNAIGPEGAAALAAALPSLAALETLNLR